MNTLVSFWNYHDLPEIVEMMRGVEESRGGGACSFCRGLGIQKYGGLSRLKKRDVSGSCWLERTCLATTKHNTAAAGTTRHIRSEWGCWREAWNSSRLTTGYEHENIAGRVNECLSHHHHHHRDLGERVNRMRQGRRLRQPA